MNRWLAFVCVGGVSVCAEFEIFAQDLETKQEDAPASKELEAREAAERDAQVFRVNAGASVATLSAGVGSAGTLGGLIPSVSVSGGPRIAGPLWIAFGLEGSVYQTAAEQEDVRTTAWSVGGSVALRLDVPILPKVEIGGSITPRINAQFGPYWEQLSVSGHFGVGLHLRPTNLFGIRTAVELFRAGYSRLEQSEGGVYENVAAEIYAGPSMSLTFSF
jgi:hypothetical protein